MKSMISLFIINILIILFFILSFWYKVFFIPVSILLILNIIAIYIKSSTLDKNEQKKKIVLHKVKNSLSIILGYSEAHNDGMISKNDMDEKINEEIGISIDGEEGDNERVEVKFIGDKLKIFRKFEYEIIK